MVERYCLAVKISNSKQARQAPLLVAQASHSPLCVNICIYYLVPSETSIAHFVLQCTGIQGEKSSNKKANQAELGIVIIAAYTLASNRYGLSLNLENLTSALQSGVVIAVLDWHFGTLTIPLHYPNGVCASFLQRQGSHRIAVTSPVFSIPKLMCGPGVQVLCSESNSSDSA